MARLTRLSIDLDVFTSHRKSLRSSVKTEYSPLIKRGKLGNPLKIGLSKKESSWDFVFGS